MTKYQALTNILGGFFSDHCEESEEEAKSLLEQRLLNKEYRELVSDELSAAFNDPDCSLVWLGNNEYYVVEELDDERSAKKLIQYLIGDLVRRVGAKQG